MNDEEPYARKLRGMTLEDQQEQQELMLVETLDPRSDSAFLGSSGGVADAESFDNSVTSPTSPSEFGSVCVSPSDLDQYAAALQLGSSGMRRVQTCPTELTSLLRSHDLPSLPNLPALSNHSFSLPNSTPQLNLYSQMGARHISSQVQEESVPMSLSLGSPDCFNVLNTAELPPNLLQSTSSIDDMYSSLRSSQPQHQQQHHPQLRAQQLHQQHHHQAQQHQMHQHQLQRHQRHSLPQQHPPPPLQQHRKTQQELQQHPSFIGPPAPMSSGLRRIKSSPVSLSALNMPLPGPTPTLPLPSPSTVERPKGNLKPSNSQYRLAKKAEAARVSRRRRKAYVQELEERVAKLTARLAELVQSPGDSPQKAASTHEKEQEGLMEVMTRLLSQPSSSSEELDWVIDRFVANSRKRQSAVEYFLGRAEKQISPDLQLKFAMWGLGQDDNSEPGVWQSVMEQQIGLSPEQMKALREFREPVMDLRESLSRMQEQLRKLKLAIRSHMSTRHSHIDSLRTSLTPQQVAQFCTWVDSNPLCMQMLQTVWRP